MKVLPINKHAPTRLAKYLLSYGVYEDVLFTCRSYPNQFEKVKLNKSPILHYSYCKDNYVEEMTYKE